MPEILTVLAVLFVVLAVITVLGHGIWATLAWIFGGPARPGRRLRPCVFCGQLTPLDLDRCDWCGRQLRSTLAEELSDLEAIERQLERFRRSGELKDTAVESLLARVGGYRKRLLQRPATPPPQPVVVELVPEPTAEPLPPEPPRQQAVQPAQPQAAEPTTPPATPAPPAAKPARPQPPAVPRKSWGQLLSGFLEERNIHWTELIGVVVGGLLIVGSSVAFVISLWETLEAVPYLKFFIFVTYSSAVFGVGLYARRRWKLESTGRGLLIIATLLVPLNFLAMASLSKQQWGFQAALIELISLGIFLWLVGLAARVLVPAGRWPAALAVVGNSAAVLLIARLITGSSSPAMLVAAGSAPAALFAAATAWYSLWTKQKKRFDAPDAAALLTLCGTAAFATLVALGLLVVQATKGAARLDVVWDCMALPVALAAVPVAAGGLRVMRSMIQETALEAYRTAGTTVALTGMIAMLAALCLAWPQPLAIVAVGTLNAAGLTFLALRYRFPAAHAPAMACLALAYLAGFHWIFDETLRSLPREQLSWQMLKLTVSARSGMALAGFFALIALGCESLVRRGLHRHARVYLAGCVVVAVVGLLLVTLHGLTGAGPDALRAALLYAFYGLVSLLLARRWPQPALSYLALGLLTAAPMWAMWWRTGHVGPPWAVVLAAEALSMAILAGMLRRLAGAGPGADSPAEVYRVPMLHVAEIAGLAALALGVFTAWMDQLFIDRTAAPVLTATFIAALYMLLAWEHRSPLRTWIGSMVALAGLVHTLVFNYTDLVAQPWAVAILAHATSALVAGVSLEVWTAGRAEGRLGESLRLSFSTPLCDTALFSSLLVCPVLPLVWGGTATMAWCLFWLSAVWLALAWRRGQPVLFAAHQAALALSAVVAVTAWLEGQTWVKSMPHDLFHPHSLHAYGIALASLALVFVVARIALRGRQTARELLDPAWPTIDRIIRHAVVWLQLALAAVYLVPGLVEELVKGFGLPPGVTALPPTAYGGGAWLLLGLTAVVLLVAPWERFRDAELLAGVLLAATVPCLVAGRLAADVSVASALRWGLAACFAACSLAVWNRRRLLGLCRQAHCNLDVNVHGPQIVRAVLLMTTAVPVLAITVLAALFQFSGVSPGGPLAEAFFDRIGPNLSYLVPLLLVMGVLVGYALRESSAGYAFSAGLVAELAVTLGYALSVVLAPRPFQTPELVTLIQLATITAAVWAIGWLIARRWVDVWRERPQAEGPGSNSSRVLMAVQLAMAVGGNALLLGAGLLVLVLLPVAWQTWTVAAGSWLGWIALVSMAAACAYRLVQQGRRPRPNTVGLLGMAALGLLACTVRAALPALGYGPEWGYRTLMLGWATYALFVVLATWWVASVRTLPAAQGPPQALIRAAAVWVAVAGILAVGLGLKAAFFHHHEQLWAAAAIATASIATAAMAVWRRREGWAFSAALGANLAASLAVWYYYRNVGDFGQWWLRLVQANVIASSAVALVWLAARRRLYQLRELTLGRSPLLAAQVALPTIGNYLLLIVPVAWLLWTPARLSDGMAPLADAPGWLGLVLAAAAAAWYLRQVLPGNLLHVLGGLALGAGVLAACRTAGFNHAILPGDWLAYHTLTAAWAAAGLAILSVGWLGRNLRLSAAGDPQAAQPAESPQRVFPSRLVQGWVTAIGGLALALAVLYAAEDRAGVWWSIRAIGSVSVMAGVLALWLRRPAYVFISGLLVNVAGTVAWMTWGSPTLAALIQANVLCLAVGSAVWSLLGFVGKRGATAVSAVPGSVNARLTQPWHDSLGGVPHLVVDGRPLPFAHLAAQFAVGLFALFTAAAVGCKLLALPHWEIRPFDWIVLCSAAAAVAICLWDRRSRLVLAGFYFLGFSTVCLTRCAGDNTPHEFCWFICCELAGFTLVSALLGWLLPRLKPAWRALRIADHPERWPVDWFVQAQAAVVAVAAGLCAWVSIDPAFDGIGQGIALLGLAGRAAGSPGALMLLGTAIAMTWQTEQDRRRGWQYAALALGVVLNSSLGWASLGTAAGTPAGDAPWLHRSVTLMVALAMITLLSRFALGRVLPSRSDWIDTARRSAPVLGGLALVVLAVVLAQEGLLFDPDRGAPMANWAVVVVVAVLAGLAAGCLALALHPEPTRWSDRGREACVYAAEVLAGLVALHLWLTRPWLFEGYIEKYWMLGVMGVAFCGAGLSELFHRRGLPILSRPLERTAVLLPLVPAVGFWFLDGPSPTTWFVVGLFYGTMAAIRRSPVYALLSVLGTNMGLWVLWDRLHVDFLEHPQLWLIPIALAALVAEYINHRRLSKTQSAIFRYLALSVIYVSSTADMFIAGVGENFYLPLVLMVLSVAGVLVGMVLRVRSFLVLGITFLLLDMITMIRYAAVDLQQTWIWYASGIVLGAAIIALFAVFEKRRNDVLAAMERFKDWQR